MARDLLSQGMKHGSWGSRLRALLFISGLMGGANAASEVTGTLLVQWGDPLPGQTEQARLLVEIANEKYRYPLDASTVMAQDSDWLAWQGQKVTASLDVTSKAAGGGYIPLSMASLEDPYAKTTPSEALPWLNLLCKFPDVVTEPISQAQAVARWAEGTELARYWNETAEGRVKIEGSRVVGWFTLPQPQAAYMGATGVPDLSKLFRDCAQAGHETLAAALAVQDVAGINLWFNASLGCCAWGGTIQGQIGLTTRAWKTTWLPPGGYLNAALVSHEMAHTYGARHSNNADGDGDTYDNPWDLQSDMWGHAIKSSTEGTLPKPLGGHHRYRMDWLAEGELTTLTAPLDAEVDLVDVHASGQGTRIVIIRPADWPEQRYYLLEAHVREGFGAALPKAGVLVYEINEGRAQPAWLLDENQPAGNYANTDSVVLTDGEQRVLPEGITVKVQQADGGFRVKIEAGMAIFSGRFED
jgi:hypothetical protein